MTHEVHVLVRLVNVIVMYLFSALIATLSRRRVGRAQPSQPTLQIGEKFRVTEAELPSFEIFLLFLFQLKKRTNGANSYWLKRQTVITIIDYRD